jgi:1-acyl-sn-glycerol-3-phosphate acyltransferase
VKHTALKGPWGPLGRYLGGIGIDRSRAGDVAAQLAKEFAERDQLVLAITPEGTRKRVVEWKRGFHNIALAASVPIVPVAIDYSKKAIHFFEPFMPQPDFTADLARLQAHFSPAMAYDPKQYADARGTRVGDQDPGANSGADSSSR